MKRTTYFKPSIHGWPFGNNWDWTIKFPFPEFDINLNGIGFCGGMCWTALDRFYSGIPIERDTKAPSSRTSLYKEILKVQVASVADVGKLSKMYEWQMSPRLSGHFGNPHQSLGTRTLLEWNNVKMFLNPPSGPHYSKPVTLTLIRTANDYDPAHLVQHHRVIAYGFEERELRVGEYIRGEINDQIRHVKLYIYDPNYKNDDDVYLTFYTNCGDDWISLNHSKGDRATGFFVDDIGRNYTSDEYPNVQIQKINLTDYISASRAHFDLQFRWECRVIPYFCIQVDGADWQYNDSARENYLPVGNIKQCPTKTGNMTINLELPRDSSTVAVRFLDDDSLTASMEAAVGEPYFHCSPYFRKNVEDIIEDDFFIKDKNPSNNALEQLSSPNSRIVRVHFPTAWTDPEIAFPWADLLVNGQLPLDFWQDHFIGDNKLPTKKYLGNIARAFHANFIVTKFAPPVKISATVTTIKNGQTTGTDILSSLSEQGAYIFSGFSSADYDDDTEVKITFKCTGKFGLILEDQVSFHGKSIIEFTQARQYPELPPFIPIDQSIPSKNIAKYEVAAQHLVEMGLLDLKAELQPPLEPEPFRRPPDLRPGPRPIATDSVVLLKALRSDRRLQRMINESSDKVWNDRDMWVKCLKYHSKVLSQEYQGEVKLYHSLDETDTKTSLREHKADFQRKADAVIIGAFAEKIIQVLRQDPAVKRALKLL